MKYKKLFTILAVMTLLTLACHAENPKIKIGLNFGKSALSSAVTVSFENGFQAGQVSNDGIFMPALSVSNNSIFVSTAANNVIIKAADGSVLYEVADGCEIAIIPNTGTASIPYSKIGSIMYPGILKFSAEDGKITVINIVDAELYFKGVLPSEVYPSWHEEALKAAAVATRTYTYDSISGKHSDYGVDLCATTCCQVYSGITKCQESTNKAVDDTQNQVLTYGGELITAAYHAISGGVTESAAGAWGSNPAGYPYLSVVSTPFEQYGEIARGHWTKIFYEEDLANRIASTTYRGKITSDIADITISDTTPGYLNNMTLTDNSGGSITLKTSSQVRSFFSTYSANFTIGHVFMPLPAAFGDSAKVLTASGETTLNSGTYAAILTSSGKITVAGVKSAFYLDGKGYGHGVGMSQYGAQYAAKAGYTYDQILSIYYPGTVLEDFTLMNAEQTTN